MSNTYTGIVRTYNGTILREKYFQLNNKKEGEYIEYYKNGNIYRVCNYTDGKLNGTYKIYYESGQLKAICNHIDGKINGKYKQYQANGELFCIYEYDNHKIIKTTNYF